MLSLRTTHGNERRSDRDVLMVLLALTNICRLPLRLHNILRNMFRAITGTPTLYQSTDHPGRPSCRCSCSFRGLLRFNVVEAETIPGRRFS